MKEQVGSQKLIVLLGGAILALVLVAVVSLMVLGGQEREVAGDEPETIEEQNSEVIAEMFGLEETDARKQAAYHEELDDLAPPHPDNPINPAAQKPYSDREMERFAMLKQVFPENKMIPVRRSPEELARRKTRDEELTKKFYVDQRIKLLQGELSQGEIDEYFDYRVRYTRDKIRLFQYALDNLPEDANEIKRRRLENLLKENEAKMERALAQKKEAYQKSDVSAVASIY